MSLLSCYQDTKVNKLRVTYEYFLFFNQTGTSQPGFHQSHVDLTVTSFCLQRSTVGPARSVLSACPAQHPRPHLLVAYPAMFTAIKLIQRLSPGSRDRGSAVRHHHHQPRSGSSTSNQSLCSHAAQSLINLRHRVPNMSMWGFPSARTRLEYLIFEIIDLVVPSQFVSF